MITPAQWVSRIQAAAKSKDWDVFNDLEREINQSFAAKKDWFGLEAFYTEALMSTVAPKIAQLVKAKDFTPFQTAVEDVFKIASKRVAQNPGIKAVYFEYFYDGGDSCTGNAFLCTEFDENDDFWAAEFEGDDAFIDGPSVFEYFNFDSDIDFESATDHLVRSYINSFLLAAWGRAFEKQVALRLPGGFAQHDHPVIVIQS
jgi:hypothetical protein